MPDKGCFDCRFKTPRLIEAADEMTGHLERLVQFIESGGEDASFIKDILARYYAERKKFGPKEEDQEVFDSFSYGEVPVIVMTKEEIEARFGKKEEDK